MLPRTSIPVATLLLCTASVSCAPATSPTATSAPADDSYFPTMGDTGFDAQHYEIRVRMDPDSGRLRGRTLVTARAIEELARFRLELALPAQAVSVDGVPAQFWRGRGLELVVQPAAPLPANSQTVIEVTYRGNPSQADVTDEYPWLSKNGEQLGIGEPRIAPWWFPVNDHPRDKATYDVVGTVPRGRQFVSNGELVSRNDGDAWTRWHWRTAEPMPSYATLFAAGRYRIAAGCRPLACRLRGVEDAEPGRRARTCGCCVTRPRWSGGWRPSSGRTRSARSAAWSRERSATRTGPWRRRRGPPTRI